MSGGSIVCGNLNDDTRSVCQNLDKVLTGIYSRVVEKKTTTKKTLQALNITLLKALAQKLRITVKSKVVENIFETRRKAPIKSQYVNKLASVVTEKKEMLYQKKNQRMSGKKKENR